MPEEKPRIPFRMGSRQRFQSVAVVPFTAVGDPFTTQPFPRVGFMSRIVVQFRGTLTVAAGAALADRGPWNLIKRFRGLVNIGTAQMIDLSGFSAFLVSSSLEAGGRIDLPAVGGLTADPDLYSFPLATGANAVVLTWVLPIAANDNEQFSLGLVNLQAPQLQFTLEGFFGAAGDILADATKFTSMTGNLYVSYEYYDVPDPRVVELPIPFAVRTLEEEQPINGVGLQTYTIPRQGLLTQLWHMVTLNAARSDSIDRFEFVVNNTDFIYKYGRQEQKVRTRYNNLTRWPTGVYLHDFWAAQSGVSNGDTRDSIDTEANALTESRIYISDSATLGANNNRLTSIRRIWQQLM